MLGVQSKPFQKQKIRTTEVSDQKRPKRVKMSLWILQRMFCPAQFDSFINTPTESLLLHLRLFESVPKIVIRTQRHGECTGSIFRWKWKAAIRHNRRSFLFRWRIVNNVCLAFPTANRTRDIHRWTEAGLQSRCSRRRNDSHRSTVEHTGKDEWILLRSAVGCKEFVRVIPCSVHVRALQRSPEMHRTSCFVHLGASLVQ